MTYVNPLLLGVLIALGACSSDKAKTCEIGAEGCSCYPNRACNSGLACENDTCHERADLDSGGAGGSSGSDTNSAETASSSGGSENDGGTFGGSSGGTTSVNSASGGSATENTGTSGGAGGSTSSTTTASNAAAGGAAGNTSSSGGQTATSDTGSTGGGGGVTASGGSGGAGSVDAVNLYLMVDSGTSMADNEAGGFTRWDIVTAGINDFLSSAELTGHAVNVGIQFFAWLSDASCDVSNYSNARVEIGPVAEVSTLIAAELAEQEVVGLTPTGPALSGAIEYAKLWAETAANDYTAVVFLTDGYPTECQPLDIAVLADLAAASYAEAPSVPVHVVGIDGIFALDAVAEAGGTTEVVEIINEGDPAPLTAALVSIATSPFDD